MPINKEIAKLHFITSNHPTISHAEQAICAYIAGCQWVQLRMKDASEEQIIDEAMKILPVANSYNGILLINDNPHIVLKVKAHGVHLGKTDMCPSKAREILGDEFIIGGTSNTLEDIISLIDKKVDYVGLGPFRFTTTKKNLSPVLGKEGYERIVTQLTERNIEVPIIAIGGIVDADIESLKETGIHGIALAGAIMTGNSIENNIQKYQQLVNV
jgi:thiamine-phosphate pyrophosphorylase